MIMLAFLNLPRLFVPDSPAGGLETLALAIAIGLGLGAIRIFGVRLGIAAVLFSALLFGQLGFTVNPAALHFLRDFALIIFMYAMGLQVGPAFGASLKAEGLRLNVLALVAVGAGAIAVLIVAGSFAVSRSSASGLYAGAYTTTPGLAAGQEAMRRLQKTETVSEKTRESEQAINALAYAVTYPFGVVGPILVIILLRKAFRVDVAAERRALDLASVSHQASVETLDFRVTRAGQVGLRVREHALVRDRRILLTRMLRNGQLSVPNADTAFAEGDLIRAVGPKDALLELVALMGEQASGDLLDASGALRRDEFVVTRTKVLRRRLRDLDLPRRTGVAVSCVHRAGVELQPTASLALQFGDRVSVVGPDEGLKLVEAEFGNQTDMLNRSQIVPIFLGIVAGVIVGSIPLRLPFLGASMEIGLAGGPMLAAIALSQLGNIGSVVWYMPVAANQLFRDFGLAVFLACVGLNCGDHFLQKLIHEHGMTYVFWGAAITMLPVFVVGCIARKIYRVNFITLSGWVAGAMTSSPALIFANDLTGSDAPSLAYAAVAPVSLLSPVICAQLLVILLK